jgi:hypothetical protein
VRVAWFGAIGLVSAAAIAACAKGDASDVDNASSSSSSGSSSLLDGAPGTPGNDGGPSSKDGSTTNTDANAPKDGAVGQDASGLDPDLKLPGAGEACTTPGAGSGAGCPSLKVCRISSTTGGRCESCGPCGNLNAACTASSQCDILFQCYKGRCTNFCNLGSMECGAPADCINVGHATHGVCNPF